MSTERSRTLGVLRLLAIWLLIVALVSLARPTPGLLALGLSLVAIGEAIRIWSAGHLVKNQELVVSGPYRFVRNPLYLGRLLIFSGLAVAARLPFGTNWIVLVVGWAIFFFYYLPRKERVEPTRLEELHGKPYADYRRSVPSLLPSLRPYVGGNDRPWSLARMLHNREHWMVAGLALAAALLFWKL